MSDEIKTPRTHPDHSTVGHMFRGNSTNWYCDSYEPRLGFWLVPVTPDGSVDPARRKNVSERAIGRTYMEIADCTDHWWVLIWNIRLEKSELVLPRYEDVERVLLEHDRHAASAGKVGADADSEGREDRTGN